MLFQIHILIVFSHEGFKTAHTVSQVVTNTASQKKKQLKQKPTNIVKIFCQPRAKRRPTNADMQSWHCHNELKSMLMAVGVCKRIITKQDKDNVCTFLSTCERVYTLYLFLYISSSSSTGHKQRDISPGGSFLSMHWAQRIISRVPCFRYILRNPV
ncbi:unnamed protein product [Ixodes pacificus]